MTDTTQQPPKEAHIKQVWTTLTCGKDFIPVDEDPLPVGLGDVLDYRLLSFAAAAHRSTVKNAPKGVTLWNCHMCDSFAIEFEEQGVIDQYTTIYWGAEIVCDAEIYTRDYDKYVYITTPVHL